MLEMEEVGMQIGDPLLALDPVHRRGVDCLAAVGQLQVLFFRESRNTEGPVPPSTAFSGQRDRLGGGAA
jgi:hypothetical protein